MILIKVYDIKSTQFWPITNSIIMWKCYSTIYLVLILNWYLKSEQLFNQDLKFYFNYRTSEAKSIFSANFILSKVERGKGFNDALDILIKGFLSAHDEKLLQPVVYFHGLMPPDFESTVSSSLFQISSIDQYVSTKVPTLVGGSSNECFNSYMVLLKNIPKKQRILVAELDTNKTLSGR